MPYIKNTYRYKNIVEVERVHSWRYGKKYERSGRRLPTPEEMEKINERNAVKKLRRKIYANFEEGDLFMTYTYRRKNRPTVPEARKELQRFLSRLRAVYRKKRCELRYIVVTEYMSKAIHHHLILNDLPDGTGGKTASGLWKRGGTNCKYLYEEGQYELLASYLIKETGKNFRKPGNPAKCRYSCSRNLVEPRKETEEMKRDDWPEEPRIPKGYCLDKQSLFNGVNKLGYRYQYYRMLKLGWKKGKGNGTQGRKGKNHKKRNAGNQKNGPRAAGKEAGRSV